MEGADPAVGALDDHDVVGADLRPHVGPGPGQLAGRNGIEPVAAEDLRHIPLVDAGIGIEGLLERETGPAAIQKPFQGVCHRSTSHVKVGKLN